MNEDELKKILKEVAGKLTENKIHFSLIVSMDHKGSVVTNVPKIMATEMMLEGIVNILKEKGEKMRSDMLDKILEKNVSLLQIKPTKNEC